jgi:hypothetical protein
MVAMLPWLAAFVACALAMTVAMVRFTGALIDPHPSSNQRALWGLGYGLAWAGIAYYLNAIPPGEIQRTADLRWLTVFSVSGWTAFNAIWLIFWFAIGRAGERSGEPAPMPPDAALLERRAKLVGWLAVIALVIAAWNLRISQAAAASMFASGARGSTVALLVAGAGFAMFMVGGIRLALYGGGSKSITVAELTGAWHQQRWRSDPWLSVFLMFAGVILGLVGGFAAGLLMSDTTGRVVIALFIAYAIVQVWRGVRRRPR